MRRVAETELSKYQRYRVRRSQQGMKLLRVWVPDPVAEGFLEEAKRQAAQLKGAPEEAEVLEFIETHVDVGDWTP
mgnify:CR=1 FL=1